MTDFENKQPDSAPIPSPDHIHFCRSALVETAGGWAAFLVTTLLLPLFCAAWAMQLKQVLFGFDDFPLGAVFLGFAFGAVLIVLLLAIAQEKSNRLYWISKIAALLFTFEVLSIPLVRVVERYIHSTR